VPHSQSSPFLANAEAGLPVGLILIYFIHKHRFSGLLTLAVGAAIAGLVYAFFVP
jgi:hypothetical protein